LKKKHERPKPIRDWLRQPVIPVVHEDEADPALLADASLIFLQGIQLAQLSECMARLRTGPTAHTPVILHLDLLAGLSSDVAGLEYLAGLQMVDGIITVRSHLVAAARRFGLVSILLVFLQDGRSVERGQHVIEQSRPDAIELVPGVAALHEIRQFRALPMPLIAGGLIRTPDLARQLLAEGFRAVSTSAAHVWGLNREARS
jgi:glycerol uptake operon antiterminator